MAKVMLRLALLTACLALAGCASGGPPQPVAATGKKAMPEPTPFSPQQLMKADVDRMADVHRMEAFASLRLITEKLYRRNPREWRQAGRVSLEDAMARIFDAPRDWQFPELGGKRDIEALRLAFQEDFHGDRVLAFSAGLGGMLDTAFNGKTEFFLLDDLEPQKIFNCARNVEIAVWKLNNTRDSQGNPLLLSNEGGNLSFERELGKLIGNLDILSRVVADKTNRGVVRVMQGLATAVFLPVPR